ncbi:MAG: class I SAM-dependent methyltransferase [Vicinamibacterales bacterium]
MSLDELLERTSRAEASHFWFRGFRQFVTPLLDRAAAGRRDLSILDCGCGTGYNLRQLARYGRAVGLDLTTTGLSMARGVGRPLAQGDATRLPFASRRFDLVTSFDMLQCVRDDRRAVDEIARVLKPVGCFVGTVAALKMLHGDHALLSKEVTRYSRGGLLRLLRGAGFDPLVARYAFASIFPLVLGVRTLQRLRGTRVTALDIAIPPAPINAALTAVVSVEAALARHVSPPFGSSLVFLAVKS